MLQFDAEKTPIFRQLHSKPSLECCQSYWARALWRILLAASLVVSWLVFATVQDLLSKESPNTHAKALPKANIGTVEWHSCDFPVISGVDCGSIVVPLDYFNHSKGTSTLALARYRATAYPKLGTVFYNPGGPGGSGVDFTVRGVHFLVDIIGPNYDIIGFDPRGIGRTTPRVQCFPTPLHQQLFRTNTVLEHGFTVSSNLSDPGTRGHLIYQYRDFLALKKTQAELCAQNMGDELRYMGTATVARDIDFMATIFDGEDALINYYGTSYGTVLGAYLVNMFPDRVGRVAIDGVVNPVLWAEKPSQYWHRDWISSTEYTYDIFLRECFQAGRPRCPLVTDQDSSPETIGNRIDKFLDDLYTKPLPVPNARRPGYLTAGGVRALLFIFLSSPSSWPRGSSALADAMSGNGTTILNILLPQYTNIPLPDLSYSEDLSRLAVTCLDSPPPASEADFPTPEELADIGLRTIRDVSKHFGMSVSISESDGGCQYWPVRGPERFTGPWNHTLRNPILIVSNTADPVTPIASGRLINSLLKNSSRLLIQDSPGHCSSALPSLCTIKAYRAFYSNGTLPPNEFVCNTDRRPFPQPEDTKPTIDLSDEDRRLLQGAEDFGQMMMRQRIINILGHDAMLMV